MGKINIKGEGYREPTAEELALMNEQGQCQVIRVYKGDGRKGAPLEKACPNPAVVDEDGQIVNGLCEHHSGTKKEAIEEKPDATEVASTTEEDGSVMSKKAKKAAKKSTTPKAKALPRGGVCEICKVDKETTRTRRDGKRVCEYCARLERTGKKRSVDATKKAKGPAKKKAKK